MYKIIKNQKGSAIVISLLMLLMLSLIVIAAVTTSVRDMDISHNSKNRNQAFYAADGGLSHAVGNIASTSNKAAGSLPLTQLSNGTSYSTSWTAMDPITSIMTLTSTGYKGSSSSAEATTVLEQKIKLTDYSLDDLISLYNFGGSGGSVPLSADEYVNIYGKVRIFTPPVGGLQVSVNPASVKFAGVTNITINGVGYVAKVNNPVNDGVPNQFALTIGGVNYTGTVAWDNPANPTTGISTIVIAGVTYTGIAKPGYVSLTQGAPAYSGPPLGSPGLGYIAFSIPTLPPPTLSIANITSLGVSGAAAGGYLAPSGGITFGNSDLYLILSGGGILKYYDGATHTIDFTAIPGGILYLPDGFTISHSYSAVNFKGLGTIVTVNNGIRIEKSLTPAPGFEQSSSLGLVTAQTVTINTEYNPVTIYAHIYSPSEAYVSEFLYGFTFYGSFVGSYFRPQGNAGINQTYLYYRKPMGIIPGLAYLGANLKVEVVSGTWREKI